MLSVTLPLVVVAEGSDPVSSLLNRDWAAVTGWGLFFALVMFLVIGMFRGWWVPGTQHRKLEDAAARQSETLATTAKTLEEQVRANEITKYFFEETAPRRRDAQS